MTAEDATQQMGVYFAAYRENATVFTWYPTWCDEPEHAEEIMSIIKSGLEGAPIEERKIIASVKMLWIQKMMPCPDDNDLSLCSFYLDIDGVTTCAGDPRGLKGLEAARQKTSNDLLKFVEGFSDD